MAPKTNPYDMTTPSGVFPIMIPRGVWDGFQREGVDMRWYAVSKRIPTEKQTARCCDTTGGLDNTTNKQAPRGDSGQMNATNNSKESQQLISLEEHNRSMSKKNIHCDACGYRIA